MPSAVDDTCSCALLESTTMRAPILRPVLRLVLVLVDAEPGEMGADDVPVLESVGFKLASGRKREVLIICGSNVSIKAKWPR